MLGLEFRAPTERDINHVSTTTNETVSAPEDWKDDYSNLDSLNNGEEDDVSLGGVEKEEERTGDAVVYDSDYDTDE